MCRTSLTLTCPSGCLAEGGSVYGSGLYSGDSKICLAAIHAGVIPPQGGKFVLYKAPGQASYRGALLP